MARKVLLDVDPGIDDAVALTMALFDPRLEVVAVTAVAGNVAADQATRNVQGIIEQLDPPRWPRMGVASAPDQDPLVDTRHIFGARGLGDASFEIAELHHQHPSEKVIADAIRSAPDDLTIVALGPLTNLARTFRRDPTLAAMVGQVVIMGAAVASPGNVTAAAEFNIYCDPQAARDVFRSRTTKTIIPLDATSQVLLTYDLLDHLPGEDSAAGKFLGSLLPFAFRSHRQVLGLEGVHLHDAVALLAVTNRELFTFHRLPGDVEIAGDLTQGATVFDRRPTAERRQLFEVAMEIDVPGATDAIMRGLSAAGNPSS